jgi:putative hemolysin
MAMQGSEHGSERGTARGYPKQPLLQILRPENVGALANSAITWLKPPPYILPSDRSITSAPLSLGRLGSLEARLAQSKHDVKQAQKLRYKVFYKDGNAIADARTMLARRDKDAYDRICDHLLVIDHDARPTRSGQPRVVGTYRLLRQDVAKRHDGFYTENEFDISGLTTRHDGLRFLELGRSCVLPAYRNKRTIELLWQGIWNYVCSHRLDVMIGCASLTGTDPERLALPLSFLHHFARAPDPWQAGPLPSRRVEMNRVAKHQINHKAALRELPPLIKAYLRLGAHIGDGAVIDHQFGTTDVLIVLPVSVIKTRYIEHFGAAAA